ncbi:MAG: AAA family ATPase [Planctomycetaceae bacterium]|jgi:SpoVK/Ycf46/Vps4 family AAA+-type ATPase|nr:AAA family ATPase [Planctomycetaceae bacterium]
MFFCKRLSEKLTIHGGRRQFVLSGKTGDVFFADSVRGVCKDVESALLYYAVLQDYEIAFVIEPDMTLRFATPEMQEKYKNITEGKSVDTKKTSKSVKRGQSAAPKETADSDAESTENKPDASAAVSQIQQNSLSKAQSIFDGIRNRLIPHQTKTFIVLSRAGLLMQFGQDGDLTEAAKQKIQSVRHWAMTSPGNPQTCSILLVNDTVLDNFHLLSRRLVSGIDDRTTAFCIESPDETEIRSMLVRLKCRYGMTGNVRKTARRLVVQCETKNDGLYNLAEHIKVKMQQKVKPSKLEELFEDKEEEKRRRTLEEAKWELNSLVGLATVKAKVKELVGLAGMIKRRQDAGQETSAYSLHSLLTGNPGTGKTVVARILGKIYYGLGLRTSDKVVEISVADISSEYNPGDVTAKLRGKIAEAMGGVLFIDEIYQFADNDWLKEAFENVLMKTMEDYRDQLTVLGAGYGGEYLQKTLKINPGVPRRFNHPDNTIEFPNYNVEELLEITKRMLKKENYHFTKQAEDAVKKYIEGRIRVGKMENAGGARNLVETVIKNAAKREEYEKIDFFDIPSIKRGGTIDEILDELGSNFIGLQSVKDQIKRIAKRIAFNEREGLTTDGKYNMQFIGNPGTGKTTIARYMSRVFNAVGLIEGIDVVEVSATSLKGSYVGHSKDAVIAAFTKAREEGKVLFIDEAHNLYSSDPRHQDSFSQEVIATIVPQTTAPQNARVFTILAGYPEPMRNLMNADPGLQRRFPLIIEFPDYSAEECFAILRNRLAKKKFNIDSDAETALHELINQMKRTPNFGNAGTMESLAETLFDNHLMRDDESKTIMPEDLPEDTSPT